MNQIKVVFKGFMSEPPDFTLSSILSHNREIIHFGGDTCYLICIKEINSWRGFFLIPKKYVVMIYQTTYRNLDDVLEIAMTTTLEKQRCYLGRLSKEEFLSMTEFWPEFLRFISQQKVAQSKTAAITILAKIVVFMVQCQPKKRFLFW